jgi:hypothetical protein
VVGKAPTELDTPVTSAPLLNGVCDGVDDPVDGTVRVSYDLPESVAALRPLDPSDIVDELLLLAAIVDVTIAAVEESWPDMDGGVVSAEVEGLVVSVMSVLEFVATGIEVEVAESCPELDRDPVSAEVAELAVSVVSVLAFVALSGSEAVFETKMLESVVS